MRAAGEVTAAPATRRDRASDVVSTVVESVKDRARHRPGSGPALGAVLERLRQGCGGVRVVSSFADPAAARFQSFRQRFAIAGVPPSVNDDVIYFASSGRSAGAATFAPPEGVGPAAVLHCMATVHSGSADHFHCTLLAANGSSLASFRLGTESLTLLPGSHASTLDGRVARLYSLAAGGGQLSLHVDGALAWRRRVAEISSVAGVSFSLRAQSAVGGTDGAVFEFDLWSLATPFAGFDPEEEREIETRIATLVRRRDLVPLHDLIVAIEGLTAGAAEPQLLAAMTELVESERGHREWLFDGIARSLSAAGLARWTQQVAAVRPRPVVDVSGLVVRLSRNPARDLSLRRLFGRRARTEFLALDGIELRAFPGDIVGVLGHNGAGKSTLLRALAGLVPIARGRIFLSGGHLLLRGGLGLRLELTGRENITSLAIHMGLSLRRIADLIDEIVEFSELGDHIDKPVKYYSDGMVSRLVFSTATSVSPEILMLDELLGAGDIRFQAKAEQRLHEFIGRSHVVIVVTHSVTFVRERCNKALVLSHGRQLYFGDARQAVARYLTDLQS